jgi:predicted nucleic acid-binding protein
VSFLLDTNLVSEWTRPRPNRGVIEWLAQADEDRVFISIITLAELRHGVDRLPAGKRRSQLDEWLRASLPMRFEGRVLAIDAVVADACGILVAQRDAMGRPIQAMDALIAATARVRQLSVVTRNVDDFKPSVAAINPWHED